MYTKEMSFIILAGGRSSRMGTDKANLDFGGKTFLETIISKAVNLEFNEIIVSGSNYNVKKVKFVPDELVNRGPLGGLYSGFKAAKNKNCFVVSVDTPLLKEATISEMIYFHHIEKKPITLLIQKRKIEPLIGIYPSCIYRDILTIISEKSAPVFRLLDKYDYAVFELTESSDETKNINTQEDYVKYIKSNK